MIYVLSGDRRDTQAWALSEGLKFVEVKHVQNSGSLPGVLSAKHRVVKLSSYANRRDHWSIDAKLRLINRRELVQVEEVQFDRFEKAPEELPLEDLYADAILNDAEEDFSVEDEDNPTPDAPETPDVAASDQEPAEQIEEKAKVEGPPADDKEKYPGVLEIGGALPVSPKFDPDASKVTPAVTSEVPADESLQDTKPVDPPVKTRRKKEQVAYDSAKAAHDANPSADTKRALEQATEALRKRFPDDERLGHAEASDDLDF